MFDTSDPKHPVSYNITTYLTSFKYVGFDSFQLSELTGHAADSRTPDPGPTSTGYSLIDANGHAAGKTTGPENWSILHTAHDGNPLKKTGTFKLEVMSVRNLFTPGGTYWATLDFEDKGGIHQWFMLQFYGIGINGGFSAQFAQGNDKDIYTPMRLPFERSFPPSLPNTCQVSPGDTFDKLADQFYAGTGSAPMLAITNGLSPGDLPPANRKLNLPDIYRQLHVDTTIHPSYQVFMDKMRGSIVPHFKLAAPRMPSQHHNFWRELIEVVAAAIIVIAAPQLSYFVLNLLGAGIIGAFNFGVLTAVTGTLLSLAEQGIVTGRVDMLSALEVGISAGITGGFAYNPTGAAVPTFNLFNAARKGTEAFRIALENQIVSAARTAVSTQILELARTGKLNLTQVLASIASQVASAGLPIDNNIPAKFAEGFVDGAAASVLSSAITGQKLNRISFLSLAIGTSAVEGGFAMFQEAQQAVARARDMQAIRQQSMTRQEEITGNTVHQQSTNGMNGNNVRQNNYGQPDQAPPARQTGHRQLTLQELETQRELNDYVNEVKNQPLPRITVGS